MASLAATSPSVTLCTKGNSVRQGDPIAALAYLLSVQPLLSLLAVSSRMPYPVPALDSSTHMIRLLGIPIPSADGRSRVTPVAAAMADDIFVGLRDTLQLPDLKVAIAVHERASGGLNNWLKTFGLRVGALRGTDVLPPGWDPTHIDVSADVIRYLGIFMGPHTSVLAKWFPSDDTSSKPDDHTLRHA